MLKMFFLYFSTHNTDFSVNVEAMRHVAYTRPNETKHIISELKQTTPCDEMKNSAVTALFAMVLPQCVCIVYC